MHLQQLIYVSKPTHVKRDDLAGIQDISGRNNKRDHITGLLLYSADFFIQVLEGDRAAVSKTFARIYGDERHCDVELVSCRDVDRRDYPDWDMHYVPLMELTRETILRYCTTDRIDPYKLTSARLLNLCREFGGGAKPGQAKSVAA